MTIHFGKGTLTVTSVDGREHTYDAANFKFVVKPFVDDLKIQMVTPPKNKPYYRQFEKRGKW